MINDGIFYWGLGLGTEQGYYNIKDYSLAVGRKTFGHRGNPFARLSLIRFPEF